MKDKEKKKKNYSYRSLSLRAAPNGTPETLDAKNRSVEVIGATENPVRIYDWDHGDVDEVLLMSGCRMPASRQLPLLDTHERWDTRSVLGSYREMVFEGTNLVGRAFFSSVEEAEAPFTKVSEGHLTDFSIGYRVYASQYVAKDESTNIKGRNFDGPVLVRTDWEPKEISICPIGADDAAKVRADNDNNLKTNNRKSEVEEMDKKIRAYLESIGLDPKATDEEAFRFLETLDKRAEPETKKEPVKPVEKPVDVDAARAEAQLVERERSSEITAFGTRFDCMDLAASFIKEGKSVDEFRAAILDKQAKNQPDTPYRRAEVGLEASDKIRSASEDSLILRLGQSIEKPAPGAEDLQHFKLPELAREFLRASGLDYSGSPQKMIARALSTSDFSNILSNVANKRLLFGWESQEETWQQWCATGSVNDFKTNTAARAGEISGLLEVPEGSEYQMGKQEDAKEEYQAKKYGIIIPFTMEAMINDDLNALDNKMVQFGEASARLVGDVVYAALTANAAMGDGVALFHATHANYIATGSGAAPGIATLSAGRQAMREQTDISGLKRLNIKPKYILIPPDLETSTEVLLNSILYADEGTIGTADYRDATTRTNPFKNQIVPICESRLGDDSSTAWYLAAQKGKTITVYFLNGKQSPEITTQEGFLVDGIMWKAKVVVVAKAMDWRGLYLNKGV